VGVLSLVLPIQALTGFNMNQFNDSFERCINDPLFLDQFYEIFLASSGEVSAMFKDTDMGAQKAMLMTSLVYMSDAHKDTPGLLASIAEKHDINHLNIKPYFYALWLDSLIAAAKSIDPLFDVNTEKLWRDTLQLGIDFMISKYEVGILEGQ
jgi:hemoglobin-like flavoprotein